MFFRKRDTANTTLLPPSPYVLAPTGEFDGNDGKWSTFFINLGDEDGSGRGQNFKVLISTSSPIILVPGQAEWCNNDCAEARGVEIFNGKQPSGLVEDGWKESGLYDLPLPDWWSGNDSLGGHWFTGNVGLGTSSSQSLILTDQFVVDHTNEDFYMGTFGLAAGAIDPGSGAKEPFITNFYKSAQKIPSVSYGYTAGAFYRNSGKGVVGNLVLGGYDETRVDIDKGVSIPFPQTQNNNTLIVGVQSILYQPDQDVEANSFSFTSGSSGFSATLDSTLPYLWLPDDICDGFAERFQLEYDEDSNLYKVNSSAHQNNQQQNATVSFKIGSGPQDSNEFTTIDLPYDAFDLQISEPIVDNETQYFPLKKSPNGIFVLGRTFLQESYVIVDYERTNFTVAPAVFSEPLPDQKLVSIYNKTYTPPNEQSPTPIPTNGDGGGGLSGGAIAGIVVGIVVVFLLAGLGVFIWWKRRRQAQVPPYTEKPSEIDTIAAGTEVKHRRVSELDSEPPGSPKPSTLGGYYGDRDNKDGRIPPISEMDSPPAELYSPPPVTGTPRSESGGSDYFIAGNKMMRRRGATRESSGNNTPGTPAAIAELPGDDGGFQVGGIHFDKATPSEKGSPVHSRGASDTSLPNNIDEVMKRPSPSPDRQREKQSEIRAKSSTIAEGEEPKEGDEEKPKEKTEGETEAAQEAPLERRPSHTRGLSDTTIQSESTAVSQPSPEELEQWAMGGEDGPRRPLSE